VTPEALIIEKTATEVEEPEELLVEEVSIDGLCGVY
jgi:mycofactocin precursor